MSFEQSVTSSFDNECPSKAAIWISLGWSSLGKKVIKWGKTDFSVKTTWVEAIKKVAI